MKKTQKKLVGNNIVTIYSYVTLSLLLLCCQDSYINNRKITENNIDIKLDLKKTNDSVLYGIIKYDNSLKEKLDTLARYTRIHYSVVEPIPFDLITLKSLDYKTIIDPDKKEGVKFPFELDFKKKDISIYFILEDEYFFYDDINDVTILRKIHKKFVCNFKKERNLIKINFLNNNN
ncbi:MAG: hypothetical protein KGZ81_12630 [Flavobacteriales bacterium]|nr:hypothetical protein [Flavobacteriales bacterium]